MNQKKASIHIVTPGNEKVLDDKASKKDIKNKNFTKVVTLSYDEVNPS